MPASHPNFHYESLHALLTGMKHRGKLRYIPNRGNAGDSLIAAATWQLFDRLGMAESVEIGGNVRAGEHVIYAGGGNLIPEYAQARTTIEECMRTNVGSFVLLPHSIRGNEDLLQEMDGRFHLFCREQQSFAHANKHARRAHVYLTHDLVFGLDLGALSERTGSNLLNNVLRLALGSGRQSVISYVRWRLSILAIRPGHQRELRLMRGDVEAKHGGAYSGECADRCADKYADRYADRFDLSSKHQSAYRQRREAELVSRDFFDVLKRADHIVSDRLHVCIAAALLGKRVTMLDNSYGKNASVFVTSMQANFPRVTFPEIRPGPS